MIVHVYLTGKRTVNALHLQQVSKPRLKKMPRMPRVVELLRKALEWNELLESGESVNQADISRREGLSRARVTQIMDLLNLASDIQKYILSMTEAVRRPVITERALRPLSELNGAEKQLVSFSALQSSLALTIRL